jgi:hypothetical protein
MINLGLEKYTRRLERIIDRKLNIHIEDATRVGRICRSEHDTLPIVDIGVIDRPSATIQWGVAS